MWVRKGVYGASSSGTESSGGGWGGVGAAAAHGPWQEAWGKMGTGVRGGGEDGDRDGV